MISSHHNVLKSKEFWSYFSTKKKKEIQRDVNNEGMIKDTVEATHQRSG